MTEAWRRKERHGDRFAGCSGYSERPEAPKVILWGSWRLCTPSLTLHLLEFNSINQYQIILPRSKYFQQQWEKRNEILLNFKNHPRGLVFKSTQMIFSRKYIPLIWPAGLLVNTDKVFLLFKMHQFLFFKLGNLLIFNFD